MYTVVNASLMAPLDVARFALAYLVLAIVPGYALAALLRPRAPRSEHFALAIPCAYTLVAFSGLATALLHLPYGLLAYAVPALPVTLAGAYIGQRKAATADRAQCNRQTTATAVVWQHMRTAVPWRRTPAAVGWRAFTTRLGGRERWWLVPAGVALVEMVVAALVCAGYVVPPNGDPIKHTLWTNAIARSHVFPIALLSAQVGTGDGGGFYPPVFHVLTALVLSIAPMATYKAVFYSMAVTVVVLPLALFTYVRAATDSGRLGALAAVASLAFDPLPFFVPTQGLYTFTVAQLFVPALAITLRDGLRGDRRAVCCAALLGVGLFYTHPTEFVTAALLVLAIVPGTLRTARAWVRAAGHGTVIGGVWLLSALPALAAVHRTMVSGAQPEIRTSHYFAGLPHIDLSAVLGSYVQQIYGRNESYALLAMVVVGAAWCLVHRRRLGLVAAQAIMFALFVDATGYNLLHRFYELSFPWALWERLAATHYWFALPLAAIGIDATARGIRRIVRAKSRLFVALVASPLVLLGLLLPLDVTVERVAAFTQTHVVMAAPDLSAIAWLAGHAPAGSIVANDSNLTPHVIYDAPSDAGAWMPDMGGPQPLFWVGEAGPGTLADRNYVVEHIADSPLPARAALFINRYHVQYVFYGAHIRVTATRHLNLLRLLADPLLHLAYSSASTCQDNSSRGPMACPASASYVFALSILKPATAVHRSGSGY
jgi:hypothetical protein